ncbi:MAG TPA: class I SAM-dependent methyltransferase [Mucilaginibacter sp.]|jgi:predicted O-methyltransferase YrrM|nr:class I SAM-dependent methyltransferase [Mucilaginibacter sp.]
MSNVRFAKDYLRYRSKAITRHGLHSPFVYRLVDNIIYDFNAKNVYAEVEEVRQGLLNDDEAITITDLGAGSRVNNATRKRVGDIAKHALKPPRLAQVIYRLVADLQPQNIIELGTSFGVTSIYLQKAAPHAHVYTLEGCPEIANIARESFAKAGAADIELIPGNFDDTLKGVIDRLDKIDFVFVDGNHKKDATLRYFECCLPKVHEHTLLIFDDIYWSAGMKEAWAQIKAHPQVTVTVDMFWMGLVYFRKGQVKEHFVIRI